jgi:hypothetical protein
VSKPPTLARKLGMTEHISPLHIKTQHMGLGPQELQTLAVQRGCIHYSRGDEPKPPLATESELTNEELAVALLSPCLPYEPHSIRLGTAMLSAPGNDPTRLAHIARTEHCEIPMRYIAESGIRFEPENVFWHTLLSLLPASVPPAGVLPHPTRFVAMTGFTRKGPGIVTEWQRPGGAPQIAHGTLDRILPVETTQRRTIVQNLRY